MSRVENKRQERPRWRLLQVPASVWWRPAKAGSRVAARQQKRHRIAGEAANYKLALAMGTFYFCRD